MHCLFVNHASQCVPRRKNIGVIQRYTRMANACDPSVCISNGFQSIGCEKFHAVLFLEHVCTISPPGTIYKTNCFVQTTIWMSQRYGQSNFAMEPILAPIICTHPLISLMACWCQKWQQRVSLVVLQMLDGQRWKRDWVVIGSWLAQKKSEKQRIFGSNRQTKFSPLSPILFPR